MNPTEYPFFVRSLAKEDGGGLMKKWVKEGIQAQKLELALDAYIQRKTDLRGGAKMAGVSYNRFAQEIEERRIIVLDDDGGFLERLQFLADAFDDEILREAIKEVVQESNCQFAPVT